MNTVFKQLDDIERKVTKSNKIASKGNKISLGDAIKLGVKANSISSVLKKNIKDLEVSSYQPFPSSC
jgi:hypothetical protein